MATLFVSIYLFIKGEEGHKWNIFRRSSASKKKIIAALVGERQLNLLTSLINIKLLTIEVLDMAWHPPENTNIDWGDSRGQYWYSVVDSNIISNTSIVNNCFIIEFVFSLDNCGNNSQHQNILIYKSRVDVGITTGYVNESCYHMIYK